MKIQKATCPNCKNTFEARPKLSLLGFPRFVCQKCNNKFIYPLMLGVRIIYFFLLIFLILSIGDKMIPVIVKGEIPIPGLLNIIEIIAVIALIKDFFLRKKLRTLGVDYKIK